MDRLRELRQSLHAPLRPEWYDEIGSTNTEVKARADQGEDEGLVILAGRQTAGRGRLGRSFFSPRGTGLYMSLLLRPGDRTDRPVSITSAAAAAVALAVEELSGETVGIKWVNDILLHGKKVCGILTEASFLPDGRALRYAVVGIGVNLCDPPGGYPAEIRDTAGSVFGPAAPPGAAATLAAGILDRFWDYYRRINTRPYLEDYRRRSVAVGRTVRVLTSHGGRRALVLGVDDDCGLAVRYDDGTEDVLSSGEISIRLDEQPG